MADLKRFPRPSVAVDVAVVTVVDGRLGVVVWRRTGRTATGEWALPGSFVRERERLADAVSRTLRDKCGIEGLAPTQLGVMDDPARDDRGWVLSVAHMVAVPLTALSGRGPDGEVRIVPVRAGGSGRKGSLLELPESQTALPFDHDAIVGLALDEIRARYADRPDPAGLLGPQFTVLELRRLHETVAGTSLQKDTFRRAMLPYLEPLAETEPGVVGRPARRFRRRNG